MSYPDSEERENSFLGKKETGLCVKDVVTGE